VPRWLQWAGVALVAGFILYASLFDSPGDALSPLGPLGIFGLDKWLHALGYAALGGSLAVALKGDVDRGVVAAAVAATLYGVGIEFAQAPLAERYFSFGDMAANALGAVLGSLVVALALRVLARRWRLVRVS
jgi:VanZ family protein